MPTIGILLFDGAEELDWAGPWEVLAAWAQGWPEDEVTVFTFARTDGVITCAKGLRVLPDRTWDDLPPLDVVLVPGGVGTRTLVGNRSIARWLRRLRDDGVLMTSVCTGSLLFADAGLLDARPATTHWGSLDYLAQLGAGIEVRPDDRFVDSGSVITAAGVSAGIDMALHLVVRLHSPDRARDVRRYIQYDPDPPV
ncbi:MAG: DJ-1/PfpI family protein [Acidimicrobiia bacterium]|nr:DJ-1/PfpI family protein [Acidimicrobiia bacterium]